MFRWPLVLRTKSYPPGSYAHGGVEFGLDIKILESKLKDLRFDFKDGRLRIGMIVQDIGTRVQSH